MSEYMERAFCANCLDCHTYTIKSEVRVHRHPQIDKAILVDEWYAVCDNCGYEVYAEDIESRNLVEFDYMCGATDFKDKLIEQNSCYDEKLGCDMIVMSKEQLDLFLKYFVEEKIEE